MTEYWKSVSRKFCDFCKCWITDNKPSVEYHEKGKKHQENVKRRLSEIAKKGKKDYLQQKKMDKDMAKMEKAALAALKKDIEANPELASQYGVELELLDAETPVKKESSTNPVVHVMAPITKSDPDGLLAGSSTIPDKEKKLKMPILQPKLWYEAVSDEGYTYYWNVETKESKWEAPDDYLSLNEQQTSSNNEIKVKQENSKPVEPEEDSELSKKFAHFKEKITQENEEDGFDPVESCNAVGPMTKPDPYGKWTVVVKTEPVDKPDLQLPKAETETVQVIVPKKDLVKFKEKVADSSSLGPPDGSSVGFKRRKNTSFKRNIRRRDEDEAS